MFIFICLINKDEEINLPTTYLQANLITCSTGTNVFNLHCKQK